MKKYQKYFKKTLALLLPEQRYAYEQMQIEKLLQLNYACGFGKSFIIGIDLLNGVINTNGKLFAVCSHRLALNDQHITDLFNRFKPLIGEVAFAFVGSDGGLSVGDLSSNSELNTQIFNYNLGKHTSKKISVKSLTIQTTKSVELQAFIKRHLDENRKIIIVSTYQSANLLAHPDIHLNSLYCDEAHELASTFDSANKTDSFIKSYLKINSDRKFFFTATPRDCSENPTGTYLMNNKKIFGRRIGMSHLESIQKGYILGCMLETVRPEEFITGFNIDYNSIENKAYIIFRSFKKHEENFLRERSAYPDLIAPKLLVRCSSVEKDMWPIYNAIQKYFIGTNVKLLASASKDSSNGSVYNNMIWQDSESLQYSSKEGFSSRTKVLPRKNYIEALQSIPDNEPAIVFHHDTISEGINVPGFTCFMPLSDNLMDFGKLLQNIGRVFRLNVKDKENLKNGLLKVGGSGWIKPEAHIIIPYWSDMSLAAQKNMSKVIFELCTNISARTSTEVPYGSNNPTGYGSEKEVSTRKKGCFKELNIANVIFEEEYSLQKEEKRRENINLQTANMTLADEIEFILSHA